MMFTGLVQMIGRIGHGMGVEIMKKLACALLFVLAFTSGSYATPPVPVLAIWDDAVIGDDLDLSKSETAQFIYSNVPLKSGDKFTALVPMDPGYRVLCCIEIASQEPLSIADLAKKYPRDNNFVRRLKSLKGVQYAYATRYVADKEMNPAMRRMAKGSGDTYYSAPALLGVSLERSLDSDSFPWGDWGRITLNFKLAKNRIERYLLDGAGKSIAVSVEALPD
jgi:hypothetical protein